jgi:hypothetical protein
MNPLKVSLPLIRNTIVSFGYACWASLVVIGLLSFAGAAKHPATGGCVRRVLAATISCPHLHTAHL